MSGITGGLNFRSSGIVNNSSTNDGEVYTGTGSGLPINYEASASGGKLLKMDHAYFGSGYNVNPFSASSYTATPYTISFTPTSADSKILIASSFNYGTVGSANTQQISLRMYADVGGAGAGYIEHMADSLPWSTALTTGSGVRYYSFNWTFIHDKGSSTAEHVYTIYGTCGPGDMFLGLDNNRNTIMCMEIAD